MRASQADADLCHVTVQASGRRIDVALPATAPILEFTPALASLCRVTEGPAGEMAPPAWTLARAAEPAFDVTSTLAGEGVLNGEVLHLVDAATWRAPDVADLVDAVTAALETGARWTAGATAWLAAGVAVASLLAGALAAAQAGAAGRAAGALVLALAAGLGGLALFAPGVAARRPTQVALAAGAAVLAGLGAGAVAGPLPGPVAVVAAGLGLVAAALALWPVLAGLAPGAALVGGALALGAAAAARGASGAQVAAVAVAAGVIGLRLWPAVAGGRLATGVADPSPAAAEAAARRSRALLASLSGATSLVLLAAALVLVGGGPFGIGLAAVAGLALGLRAQAYRFVVDVLPPALAGAGVLIALELSVATALTARGMPVAAAALPAVTGLAVVWAAGAGTAPRLPVPGTRLAWLAVDLALAPLVLGALGVFDLVAELLRRPGL
jgi:WXG100 protein secretion system (Wss), protein YukD